MIEVIAPELSAPELSAPELSAPELSAPELSAPELSAADNAASIDAAIEAALSTLETVALSRITGKGIKAPAKALHRINQGADVSLYAAHNRAAAQHLTATLEKASIDQHGRAMAAQAAGCYSAPIASVVAIADTSYTISSVTLEGKAHALRRDWVALRAHLVSMLTNKISKDGTEKTIAKAVANRVNAALSVYDGIDSACTEYRAQLSAGLITARDLVRIG